LYQDSWPSILSAEDHEHEVGEDVSRCANCRLQEVALRMSAFEMACWGWYADNVTPFAMESGITAQQFAATNYRDKVRAMFLRALSAIHHAFEMIRMERERQAMEKQ
jgi:hypothetical protein